MVKFHPYVIINRYDMKWYRVIIRAKVCLRPNLCHLRGCFLSGQIRVEQCEEAQEVAKATRMQKCHRTGNHGQWPRVGHSTHQPDWRPCHKTLDITANGPTTPSWLCSHHYKLCPNSPWAKDPAAILSITNRMDVIILKSLNILKKKIETSRRRMNWRNQTTTESNVILTRNE